MKLCNHITSLNVTKRGAVLVLQMAAHAQEIRMALGTPKWISVDGVKDVTTELKAYLAPGEPGAAEKCSRYRGNY